MHENQPDQEKVFNSIMQDIIRFEESRDKLIFEIDSIIDRIIQNRPPQPTSAPMVQDKVAGVSPFATDLKQRVRNMDLANEKLKAISNRLNELV